MCPFLESELGYYIQKPDYSSDPSCMHPLPESLLGYYSQKSEICPVGVTTLQLALGVWNGPVLDALAEHGTAARIARGCCLALWELVKKCLDRDQATRPEAATLLEYPFFEECPTLDEAYLSQFVTIGICSIVFLVCVLHVGFS